MEEWRLHRCGAGGLGAPASPSCSPGGQASVGPLPLRSQGSCKSSHLEEEGKETGVASALSWGEDLLCVGEPLGFSLCDFNSTSASCFWAGKLPLILFASPSSFHT